MNILTLRLYRGKETYNKEGKLTSPNQLYKVSHNTFDWEAFKKTIAFTFSRAEIVEFNEQVVKIEEEEVLGKKVPVARYSYVKIEVTEELKKEVSDIFKKIDKELTPDQKKIADLEKKIESLLPSSNKKVVVNESTDAELKTLRAAYEVKFGKKAHHMKTIKGLKEELSK